MLDEDSTKGVIVIESVNADQAQRANEAMSDLKELLGEFFGIKRDKSVILPRTRQAWTLTKKLSTSFPQAKSLTRHR
ncbi:hypothetical protein [Lactobacillus delbrueckii]|uniref:hypothetical protein n=1 Tax=Lactobacillus delbrueckii TaxID=1584 RepID=UPI001E4B4195|nr:hypothetical protein [Lactobacillus delbrueckii]